MDPLDRLPIDVLLQLQRAVADPDDDGTGWWTSPRFDPEPIPMEEAPEGADGVILRFPQPR